MSRELREDRAGERAAEGAGAHGGGLPGKRALTDGLIQRRAAPAAAGAAAADEDAPRAAPAAAPVDDPFGLHLAGASTGAPLPDAQRSKFESSLGVDLGGVRVHTGAASATSADRLDAHAYTTGRDIHFAAGAYDPGSARGEHLLAHEVAHTVQQGSGGGGPQFQLEVSQPGDASELEADRAADAMVAGARFTGLSPAAPALRRSVRTGGGTFVTPEYDAKRLPSWGALFTLAFTPNRTVRADHVALVQTIRNMLGTPGQQRPSIRSNGQGAATDALVTVQDPSSPGYGTRIDSPDGTNSPVYGSEAGSTGLADLHADPMNRNDRHGQSIPVGTLGDGGHPDLLGGGIAQEGYRRANGEVQQAVMTDAPGGWVRPGQRYDGTVRDVHFEVAALAVDGDQPGRWLGAIEWGYRVDAAGRSTLNPAAIHKVSDGDPSRAFAAAAQQWNDTTLPGGTETIDVPPVPAPTR